jgi:predicted Zn-dependent peptidase
MVKILYSFVISITLLSCFTRTLDTKTPIRVEEGARIEKSILPTRFTSVEGDPLKVREYTLKNGLKVFLSVNKDEPRIQTYVSVKTGGKNDPAHATGLAHYLEHMLFKGTSKLGSVDYPKEKIELDKIKALYEVYRKTTDSLKRVVIYTQIDSISQLASKYVCLNEFDQLHSAIGASGTNAYTTHENTVYITDIPTNQLENWAKLESERFGEPVLRLFHTELEAVYEEKNRSQDNHSRQQYYALLKALYKKHNYGLQTTIGTIAHLKSPSILEIEKYFYKYYVPNNMAVILSGDFDPDVAIKTVEKYFGKFEAGPIEDYVFEQEDSIKSPIEITMNAPDAANVLMAYRFEGAKSKKVHLAKMVDMILNNSKAGLIDLNINQKQKAVGAYSGIQIDKDYSMHILGGAPTQGQTLHELKDLILTQIELVKKGEFPDWLMPAIINDFKVSELKKLNSNRNRVAMINSAFIFDQTWQEKVNEIKELEKLTKADVVKFANSFYKNNYVAVYKEQSEDELVREKVSKPAITALDIPKQNKSTFFNSFNENNHPDPITPLFIDYNTEIFKTNLSNGADLYYQKNETNELFTLRFVVPVGAYHNGLLPFAAKQAKLLGTANYSAAQLAQEMYKLGMDYSVSVGQKESYVTLSGLTSQVDKSLVLFKEILTNLQANQIVATNLIKKTLQQRENTLNNPKQLFWKGLQQYAVYGKDSPLMNELSNKELEKLSSSVLLEELKKLFTYKKEILYYGSLSKQEIINELDEIVSETQVAIPEFKTYKRLSMNEDKVYVLNYDLKQADILMLSKGTSFNKKELTTSKVFNEYYGGGMSSVVFQEIREKKALAYSSFATYTSSKDTLKPQYTFGYLGTQTDKTIEAIDAMRGLLKDMPMDSLKFEQAKSSIKQQLASNRTTRAGKLYSYFSDRKLGYSYSIEKDIYDGLDQLKIIDILSFHKEKISNNNYTIIIIGNLKELDMKSLSKFGEVEVLQIKNLFPY